MRAGAVDERRDGWNLAVVRWTDEPARKSSDGLRLVQLGHLLVVGRQRVPCGALRHRTMELLPSTAQRDDSTANRSFQDFTKASSPSSCNCNAIASMSTPCVANSARTASQSPPL